MIQLLQAASIGAALGQPPMEHLHPLPPLQSGYHQGAYISPEDVATTTSPRSGMSALPKPLHPFAPNVASSSAVPPPTSLASLPPHQPGVVPPTGFSVPGPLPYPSYAPYGYNVQFPSIPPVVHGSSMTNGYNPGHAQMPPSGFHPMMGYYLPGYGQPPPPPPPM